MEQQPPAPWPHLIHIGYAKSGSNFLRQWFTGHPQIAFRHGLFAGLPAFRDMAIRTGSIRLRVTSSETFASPMIRGAQDPSFYFKTQSNVCDSLAELFPAAHILIVTRGFRSMIMSSYSQYVRSGGSKSLEELIDDAQVTAPWDYDALVGLYRRRFGTAKVMVLPWELLRDDPEAFVGEIETRFGLEHHPSPPQRVNASLTPAEMRWYPRIAAALAKAPLGAGLKTRLEKRFARLSHKNRLAGPVRLLQFVAPAPPVALDLLPPEIVEAYRGKARCLAAEPLFAPYAAEYLNDAPRA